MKYLKVVTVFAAIVIAVTTVLMHYNPDVVKTRFTTLEEARRLKAFERGWLPPVLPEGSINILEINDLDNNHGFGHFDFMEESIKEYVAKLNELEEVSIDSTDSHIKIKIINDSTIWILWLDLKDKHGHYTMGSLQ